MKRKVRFFGMDLPHRDAIFVKSYPAETAEAICDGHVAAVASFGGGPLHSLPLLEREVGALDQASPLRGSDLPAEFATLRRLLEARLGRATVAPRAGGRSCRSCACRRPSPWKPSMAPCGTRTGSAQSARTR